jgi:hypothetical protein
VEERLRTRRRESNDEAEGMGVKGTEALAETLLADRHALDTVARAVVSGERGFGAAQDALADAVASLMINRLAVANAAGHARVAHLQWDVPDRRLQVEEVYGRALLDVLLRRIDKYLAHAAMVAFAHGSS